MINPRRRALFVFGVVSFLTGMVVLFLSLLAVSPAYRSVNGMRLARKFYISNEILPDHIFYPVVNLLQRRALGVQSNETERPWLELAMAQRRLDDAMKAEDMKVSEREKVEITITLVSKAHQYIGSAVQVLGERWENGELSEIQKDDLREFMNGTEQKMLDLQKRLPEADRGELAAVMLEEKLMTEKINRQVGEGGL
ncbi:hypothetical protein FWH30_01765 [Microgenomates group bacterium]|nr:hypothetical protein [Microgenomates group bacterium]